MIILVYITLAIALIAPMLFARLGLGPMILGVLCSRVRIDRCSSRWHGCLWRSVVSLERAGWHHLHHRPQPPP